MQLRLETLTLWSLRVVNSSASAIFCIHSILNSSKSYKFLLYVIDITLYCSLALISSDDKFFILNLACLKVITHY